MKKILRSSIYFLGLFLSCSGLNAQTVYWREGFQTWTGPTSDAAAASTVGTATAEAGVWGYYGVYRTTGTGCPFSDNTPNPHMRSTNAALTGSGAVTDTAYLITPEVSNGVSTVNIIRSRNNRRLSVYWTPDSDIATTNWTFATATVKSTASPAVVCTDTTLTINQPTAKRLMFRFERGGNSDVDSIVLVSATPVLPVKFSGFSALETSGKVKLNWDIATEMNTANYVVERSSNGVSFTSAGTIEATQSKGYSFVDQSPVNGTNYYRIKGVDKDGAFMYSSILRVNVGNSKALAFTIAPNPVRGRQVNVQVANLDKGTYKLNIFNAAGQQVVSRSVGHAGGSATYQLDLPASVKSGIYNLQMKDGEKVLNKKLVVE